MSSHVFHVKIRNPDLSPSKPFEEQAGEIVRYLSQRVEALAVDIRHLRTMELPATRHNYAQPEGVEYAYFEIGKPSMFEGLVEVLRDEDDDGILHAFFVRVAAFFVAVTVIGFFAMLREAERQECQAETRETVKNLNVLVSRLTHTINEIERLGTGSFQEWQRRAETPDEIVKRVLEGEYDMHSPPPIDPNRVLSL